MTYAYHPHMHICTCARTRACPGLNFPWQLQLCTWVLNSTFEVDHVGWSPFVSRIVHKWLTSFRGHGQQQRFYVSQPQRKDPRCLPFLARSSILPLWLGSKYFRKHGSLEHSCRPQSLYSQFRRASVRNALEALQLCYGVKWLCHKYSYKSPNLNFTNIKIQPFFRHFADLMPAKFSHYTVQINFVVHT